jgi:Protein of unknown function (DUF3224)
MTLNHSCVALLAIITLSVASAHPIRAQRAAVAPISAPEESAVTTIARGTFDVTVKSLPSDEFAEAAALGRMSIDKQFHGDLEGTSKGQMLATSTAVAGSAAYVAIEKVTGSLNGRRGSFSLQHSAWMAGGEQAMTITVVPDSGTEALVGLKGSLLIIIADGKHSYEFTYSLPGAD